MITLKEAFKLCQINDKEVVWFCDSAEHDQFWSLPMTGGEVRNKYDMKNTMVTAIIPHRLREFDGFAFVIKKPEQR